MHDIAMTDITNLNTWARRRIQQSVDNSHFWPPIPQDLNLCKYYLWGTIKDTVYVNKLHSLQEIRYLRTNCKYLMIRDMTCVQKYV